MVAQLVIQYKQILAAMAISHLQYHYKKEYTMKIILSGGGSLRKIKSAYAL